MLPQQIVNGLMLGGIYAMIAVAFTLTIGVLNFLNFSIPGIFMLGAMLTWATLKAGTPWLAAAMVAILAGAAVSWVVERFTYRWMKSVDHFVPLVSSMAFLILIENLVLIRWGSDLQRVDSPFGEASWRVFGLVIGLPQLLSLGLAVALAFALVELLGRTQIGRGLRAIAENPDTALLLGVDVNRLVPVVFLVSGLFTALAGVLFALNYLQVGPTIGEEIAFKGISAMVVGGMGNIWGAIVGGLLIGLAEVLAIGYFGSSFVDIAVYGLLLLILFVRPTGVFGGARLGREKF